MNGGLSRRANDPTLVALTVMTANGVKSKGFICPIGRLLNVKSTAMRRPVSRYSGSRGCGSPRPTL